MVLDRRSPVLHLVQRIRDESHRFAISYHRKRREMRDRDSEHFGSLRGIKAAGPDALTAVVNAATAIKIRAYFDSEREAAIDGTGTPVQTESAPELRILQ